MLSFSQLGKSRRGLWRCTIGDLTVRLFGLEQLEAGFFIQVFLGRYLAAI